MMPATDPPPSIHAAAVLVLLHEAREAGILTPERAQELSDAVASDRAALLATLTNVEHAGRTAFAPVRDEAWKADVRALLTRIRSLHIAISNGGKHPEPPPPVLRSPPPPITDDAEGPAVDDDSSADGEDTAPLPRPPLPPRAADEAPTPERVKRSKMIADVGDEVIARIGALATRHGITPVAMLVMLVYSGLEIEEGTLRRALEEHRDVALAEGERADDAPPPGTDR